MYIYELDINKQYSFYKAVKTMLIITDSFSYENIANAMCEKVSTIRGLLYETYDYYICDSDKKDLLNNKYMIDILGDLIAETDEE